MRRLKSAMSPSMFFRAPSSSVMFSSKLRIRSRRSASDTLSFCPGGASTARIDATERSLTKLSDSSAASGRGFPIGRVASSPWWSTMCRSCIEWRTSIVAASFSRGPATRALDIRSALSMEGTCELPQDVLDRPVDVRPPRGGGLLRFGAASRKDPLPLSGEGPPRSLQDFSVPRFRLLAMLLTQLERLSTGGPEGLLAVLLRGVLHLADLGLGLFEFVKRFLLAHPHRPRDIAGSFKRFRGCRSHAWAASLSNALEVPTILFYIIRHKFIGRGGAWS